MKLLNLRARGFIGFQRGLGLEEVNVDFSNISGLVALSGENGSGKSSLLELAHPYNTLASRSGALFNHCYGREAEKELSFSYQGNHYRTLLKIDSQSGKSEGFLWKNGKSEVNGKISAYSKYIKELLGSPEMFFSSVFCSQNATKLSDMTTSELKTLLAEFLNLDKLAGYEIASKEKITAVTGQIEQVDKQLLILNDKLAGFSDMSAALADKKDQLADCESSLDDLKKKRVEYQAELELLRDKKSKQEVLIAQKANIEAKIKELEDTLAREQKDSDAELNGLREQYTTLQTQIKKDEELLKLADEINAAAEKEKEITDQINSINEKINLDRNNESELQKVIVDIEMRLSALRVEKNLLITDSELTQIKKSLDLCVGAISNKESQLSSLEVRDQDCKSSTCSFIVAALKAKEELPGLVTEREELTLKKQLRIGRLEVEANEIEERMSSDEYALRLSKENLKRQQEEISQKNNALATARQILPKFKDLTAKKTALEVAKSQYESVTKQMEENVTKGKELSVKWENRKTSMMGSISDAQGIVADIIGKIDRDIEFNINAKQHDIDVADQFIAETESSLNSIRASIMKFESDLSARAEVEKDIETANGEKSKLQQDISDWTYLRNACGKNGLQAMEIAGATPLIVGFANDLLMQSFGPLFTVKIQTVDDEGKECFKIWVIRDDGAEVLLDNLSGGEKVWCLMALRLGMTLLSKEKSEKNFESFFADELDGPLDADRAIDFINMYRSFMAIGKFKDGYFISHKPSCRALADNILMFEAGKNPEWS